MNGPRKSISTKTLLAAALTFVCIGLSVAAQTLTQSDINQIVEAARYNIPRYERDYRGRTFIGIGTFVGINLSRHNISVAFDNGTDCRERASCGSTPPMAYCSDHGLKSEIVADWTQRTRLRIEGTIVDINTVTSNLNLKNCKITAAR
jgi:hypothetical protein